MTVTITEDHPDGWLADAVGEPDEVVAMCKMLTDQVRAGLRGVPRHESLMTAVRQARNKAKRGDNEVTAEQRALAFKLANELLLDREDRLELAEVTVGRDITSWSELTWEEMSRVIDSLNGYVHVRHLRLERARGQG